jgi:hypothetical protein
MTGGAGSVVTVEQDSEKDVTNCVEAVLRTRVGMRPYVPQFGIEDPVFGNELLPLSAIAAQVSVNEPRATTAISQFIEALDSMIARIKTEVTARG